MRTFKSQAAFSLIELVIVIVITGILATSVATIITRPIQGFIDLSRRATLVYSAESALRRMQRDIRRALPNSIRVAGGGTAIEVINTIEGARYRAAPLPGDPDIDRYLQFNTTDSSFDILGNFSAATLANPNINHVAINNIGSVDAGGAAVAGANAYGDVDAISGTNVITPAGYAITLDGAPANEDNITINDGGGGGFRFTYQSDNKRVYLVDTAISYVCSGNQLIRYTDYAFTNNPTQDVPPVGGTSALLADSIGNCNFSYDAGSPSRSGLMTLDLSVTDAATGETVRLLHQVHVDNTP